MKKQYVITLILITFFVLTIFIAVRRANSNNDTSSSSESEATIVNENLVEESEDNDLGNETNDLNEPEENLEVDSTIDSSINELDSILNDLNPESDFEDFGDLEY